MPTTRSRHLITETDEIAAALDQAAKKWPEDAENRATLVRRLVLQGQQALALEGAHRSDVRRDALKRFSGSLTGSYGEDYLKGLREDWPE